MQSDEFEWDDEKEDFNLAKHGVSFKLAKEVFDDPLAITVEDLRHSYGEQRFVTIGNTHSRRRTIVVVHTPRGSLTRIIQARVATPAERRKFMNEKFDHLADEMLPEYDFSNGVRGMFYTGRSRTTVYVPLEDDVSKYFPTGKDVNEALRGLIAEGRVPAMRDE